MEAATTTATTNAAAEQYLAKAHWAKLQNADNAIHKYKAAFDNDWEYAFTWNAADMYAKQVERRTLVELLHMSDEHGFEIAFVEMEKSLTRFLDNAWNVRESSTNAISNEASTIKYKVYHELRAWLRETMRNERAWNKA